MEEIHNYSLAFKVEKKNPMTVEIDKVDTRFEGQNVNSIEAIDTFTSLYNYEELINLIRKSNIITEEYLCGNLIVIDNTTGWRYTPIITENFSNDDFFYFLSNNKLNKDVMNKMYNKITKFIKDDEYNIYCKNLFLEEIDVRNFLIKFKDLPYLMRREIKLFTYEMQKEKQKVKELKKAN